MKTTATINKTNSKVYSIGFERMIDILIEKDKQETPAVKII